MKPNCIHRSLWTAGLLIASAASAIQAQTPDAPAQNPPAPAQAAPAESPQPAPTSAPEAAPPQENKSTNETKSAKSPSGGERRRAVKLYLASSKLFEKEQFEEAMRGYEEATALDPTKAEYSLAAAVARSHAVTALIQVVVKDHLRGDAAGARIALAHAFELDPKSAQVAEHLRELGDDALLGFESPIYEHAASTAGEGEVLAPAPGKHSFHLHTDQRQVIRDVFKAYGLETSIDESVRATQVRLDIDDADFQQATHAMGMLTMSFYVPIDAHRVLVARDNRENRQQYTRQEMETVYLPGMSQVELTEVGTMIKTVFEAQQATIEPTAGTLTIRAPESTLNALNATLRSLIDGRSQVLLEVRLIQIAHSRERNTGAHIQQQITAFNVYSAEQAILNQNAALVKQIIDQGLASPGDIPAIIAILIASGQVTSSLFTNGFALFGGGLTQSALSPGPATLNLNLNSSDSRQLDEIQLRLGDGEAGTLRTGMRYPIMTSSFSSLGASGVNIPGLNLPGSSAGLGGLASSLTGTQGIAPQVEYQDLGLTLKATPKVMRNSDVALTIDMKIDALGGSAINGVPVLNNRAYSGVVTLRQGEGVVVLSELTKQEGRAISGTPGISEIPGLNNLTGKDVTGSSSTLLIVITPHVIRGTQLAGHTQRIRVERATTTR